MGKQYKHLSLDERDQLHLLIWDRLSIRRIAKIMDRSPSTISREIKRNTPPIHCRYTPHLAQEKYHKRKVEARQRPRLKDPKIVIYVRNKLKIGWSPEIIAGRWNKKHPNLTISYEAIYQYIYTITDPGEVGDLRPYLRRKHKRRNRKYIPFKVVRTTIPNRIGIEQRPKAVENRKQYGHWEGDSVESKREQKACLRTLVERKSRLVRMTTIKNKTSGLATEATIKLLSDYPAGLRRTLTQDNGTEHTTHQEITKVLGTKCYFANPYCSSERGTNEQTNGLIRYYFPKGINFATIPKSDIKRVENLLNNRPRKVLNYKTPQEVFNRGVALTC